MIDMQTVRVSALNNRVPNAVLVVEVVGAAVTLGLPSLSLTILGRGVVTVVLAPAQQPGRRTSRSRSTDGCHRGD